MDWGIIIARVVHIVLGAFWAGTFIFNAIFLVPAMRAAGPEGARVSAGLLRRGFMNVMPVVALLTLVSGFWLYWKLSFGFQPEYMRSPRGIWFGAGGGIAVVAFVLGVGVMRPKMMRAAALSQAAAVAPEAEQQALMATVGNLRARAARVGQIVAVLLALATAAMSIARYVA